ncbi:MAG: hypothetical protein N2045_09865 [Fimbriimonadales bacterium]|jgi:hypothetical protein|nr:hypothetical protein [Fimbriimonadales bacterium]GIV13941.1 MAG: hypothetical protein KatS3mg021_2223 [Fimbriimonadales bacterium]CUU08854.1 hypothetical protein GBSOP10_10573 [Armatimonadetes bacterium GBS]CUU34943.1 hypothetical protein GXSOP10_11972 [Armatimonadetes bacterium GXS]
MRKLAIIGLCLVILGVWAVAQNESKPQLAPTTPLPQQSAQEQNQNAQPQNTQQNAQKPSAPKEGTLSVEGQYMGFFSRGEGTLTLKGKGMFLLSDLQGSYSVSGFTLQEQLPRGVQIPPQWRGRIKIYYGNGTLTLKGKYDALRGNFRVATIQFRGNAAFNLSGVGKGNNSGKEIILYPQATQTVLVPEPKWVTEDTDVAPVPKVKSR